MLLLLAIPTIDSPRKLPGASLLRGLKKGTAYRLTSHFLFSKCNVTHIVSLRTPKRWWRFFLSLSPSFLFEFMATGNKRNEAYRITIHENWKKAAERQARKAKEDDSDPNGESRIITTPRLTNWLSEVSWVRRRRGKAKPFLPLSAAPPSTDLDDRANSPGIVLSACIHADNMSPIKAKKKLFWRDYCNTKKKSWEKSCHKTIKHADRRRRKREPLWGEKNERE